MKYLIAFLFFLLPAYIFEARAAESDYTRILTLSATNYSDYYGYQVAIVPVTGKEPVLAVGAWGNDYNGGASGAVYLYDLSGKLLYTFNGASNVRLGQEIYAGPISYGDANTDLAIASYLPGINASNLYLVDGLWFPNMTVGGRENLTELSPHWWVHSNVIRPIFILPETHPDWVKWNNKSYGASWANVLGKGNSLALGFPGYPNAVRQGTGAVKIWWGSTRPYDRKADTTIIGQNIGSGCAMSVKLQEEGGIYMACPWYQSLNANGTPHHTRAGGVFYFPPRDVWPASIVATSADRVMQGLKAYDNLGQSVDAYEDLVFIGAPYVDIDSSKPDAGAAYLLRRK